MTEEEIKKLAREYTEDIFGKDDYPFKEDDMCNAEDNFESVVTFLSKDYCIIPKVDIINQHAWYMQRMKEVSSNRQMNRGKAIALENLVGKELFNDTEK